MILAGPHDSAVPAEALAALEGKRGGNLWIINAADGVKIAEHRLEHAPRYDGLAVATGCGYIATSDGRVICLGGSLKSPITVPDSAFPLLFPPLSLNLAGHGLRPR